MPVIRTKKQVRFSADLFAVRIIDPTTADPAVADMATDLVPLEPAAISDSSDIVECFAHVDAVDSTEQAVLKTTDPLLSPHGMVSLKFSSRVSNQDLFHHMVSRSTYRYRIHEEPKIKLKHPLLKSLQDQLVQLDLRNCFDLKPKGLLTLLAMLPNLREVIINPNNYYLWTSDFFKMSVPETVHVTYALE